MASRSLPDPRREDLRHQVFRSILDSLRQLPSCRHSAFVSSVLAELIESEKQPLDLLIDAIDKSRLKLGSL
jgi:hypothetical protein